MIQRNRLRLAALALGGWLVSANAAMAESSNVTFDADKSSGLIEGPDMTGYLIWVTIALALIIGLIILVIKWLAKRNQGWGTNRTLRSLGGIPLGQNKSLQVVELSGRIYVVGVGESVTLLDKIDDPQTAQAVLDSMEQQNARAWSAPSFTDFLNRFRNRNSESGPTSEPWQEASSFQELLQNKMKRQSAQKQKVEDLLKKENHNDRLLDE
ncbi:flagellar biosynthetic protein FliO [Paenibacillus oenotherae]|uniref:Flagellar biosynthetic protein FliO n=1 Tax=Paenibacillus oenotherae TaxID=1435645 RepID=A0ABS7D0C0_9BACL|nr:flagellar biosynthetic protein FliO [Paenibacillus oenotherae]MBW7473287.1 flagellar biosynthetic protein FliO [Paenibacillus oenotherae]